MVVYLLQHSYEIETESGIFDETKLIGIFSSKEKAEMAIEDYKKVSGFKRTILMLFILANTSLTKDIGKKVLLPGRKLQQVAKYNY